MESETLIATGDSTSHDGASDPSPTVQEERREDEGEGAGAAGAGELIPAETAREHVCNVLQVLTTAGEPIEVEEDQLSTAFTDRAMATMRGRLARAVELIENDVERTQLRAEIKRLVAAIGAPRPIGVTYLIDTHRGDSVVVVNSDGSVYKNTFVMGSVPGEDRYIWKPIDPVPGSRAALVAAGGAE